MNTETTQMPHDDNQKLFSILREALSNSGSTLEEISERTKIGLPILQALTSGNVGIIDKVFARAFLRTFATEVGLNPDDLKSMLDEILPPSDPVLTATAPKTTIAPLPERKATFSIKIAGAAGLGILLLVMLLSQEPEQIAPAAAPRQTATTQNIPEGTHFAPSTPTEFAAETDSFTVTMIALDSVWVQARRDSLPRRAAVYSPNASWTWRAKKSLWLLLGRHDAVVLLRGSDTLDIPYSHIRNSVIIEITPDSINLLR